MGKRVGGRWTSFGEVQAVWQQDIPRRDQREGGEKGEKSTKIRPEGKIGNRERP